MSDVMGGFFYLISNPVCLQLLAAKGVMVHWYTLYIHVQCTMSCMYLIMYMNNHVYRNTFQMKERKK